MHNPPRSQPDSLWLIVALAVVAVFVAFAANSYDSGYEAGRADERALWIDGADDSLQTD